MQKDRNRKLTVGEAFGKLSALCSRSEHAPADIEHKMRDWNLSEEEQTEVMQRLFQGNYLDTHRYARAFVHDKLLYSGWGRRKMQFTLRQKAIESRCIDEAFEEMDEEVYRDVLCRLLTSKMKQTKAGSASELRLKLLRFAVGRGFEMDIADDVIRALMRHSKASD